MKQDLYIILPRYHNSSQHRSQGVGSHERSSGMLAYDRYHFTFQRICIRILYITASLPASYSLELEPHVTCYMLLRIVKHLHTQAHTFE